MNTSTRQYYPSDKGNSFRQIVTYCVKAILRFLLKQRIIKLRPYPVSLSPFALRGFVSLQWSRLRGVGITTPTYYSRNLSISNLIEIKVKERTSVLESSRKELEALGYTLSHDLKAPLRIIRGYCDIMMNSSNMLVGEGPELMVSIKESTERMGELIDDLIRLSKLECADIQKERLDMQRIVEGAISDCLATSGFRPSIRVKLLPDAYGQAVLIKQVWVNLIGNAIKYSSKNPKAYIEIGVHVQRGMPVYYIMDNGSGFSMKNYDRLFKIFHRLHSDSEYEGTGIGLALVEKIVAKHGGKIWADAEVGKGAIFFFTLT